MGSVAQLLADSLEAHSIDQVFCVPGESYIGLTSALVEREKVHKTSDTKARVAPELGAKWWH